MVQKLVTATITVQTKIKRRESTCKMRSEQGINLSVAMSDSLWLWAGNISGPHGQPKSGPVHSDQKLVQSDVMFVGCRNELMV